MYNNELYHFGIKGQKWGVRRFQNEDGTLTEAGKQKRSSSERSADIIKKRKDRGSLHTMNVYDRKMLEYDSKTGSDRAKAAATLGAKTFAKNMVGGVATMAINNAIASPYKQSGKDIVKSVVYNARWVAVSSLAATAATVASYDKNSRKVADKYNDEGRLLRTDAVKKSGSGDTFTVTKEMDRVNRTAGIAATGAAVIDAYGGKMIDAAKNKYRSVNKARTDPLKRGAVETTYADWGIVPSKKSPSTALARRSRR